jgi:hypothetical protein
VLPDAYNVPSGPFQVPPLLLVSLLVAADLWLPIGGVGLRDAPVLRAAVPEAPIDEYCEVPSGEDYVRPDSASARVNRQVDT